MYTTVCGRLAHALASLPSSAPAAAAADQHYCRDHNVILRSRNRGHLFHCGEARCRKANAAQVFQAVSISVPADLAWQQLLQCPLSHPHRPQICSTLDLVN